MENLQFCLCSFMPSAVSAGEFCLRAVIKHISAAGFKRQQPLLLAALIFSNDPSRFRAEDLD